MFSKNVLVGTSLLTSLLVAYRSVCWLAIALIFWLTCVLIGGQLFCAVSQCADWLKNMLGG
jgi:hypothetical protein